jgi:hypothetical protein
VRVFGYRDASTEDPAMRLRPPFIVALIVSSAVAVGLTSSGLLERAAVAQKAPSASTIYIPPDGLTFRTFDGRAVARLSYDDSGGVLELFDEHEKPGASIRGSRLSTARTTTPPECTPPYVFDSRGIKIFRPECF